MLNRHNFEERPATSAEALQLLKPIDVSELARAIWRNFFLVWLFTILFSVAAVIYCFTVTPLFSAKANVLIGPRQPLMLTDQKAQTTDQIEAAYVDSQVEVLKSGRVLGKVIDSQSLVTDTEFTGIGTQMPWTPLLTWLRTPPAAGSPDASRMIVLTKLRNSIEVKRVGLTYVLSISVTTKSPEKSARIANSVTDAFLRDSLEARSMATQVAETWLEGRVKELRNLAVSADARVQDFRAKNNIVTTNKGLITDQQVSEISTQLTEARALLAEKQAKSEKIDSIIASNTDTDIPLNETVDSDAFTNDIIVKLRSNYVDNTLRIAELTKAYGASHTAVGKLKAENKSIMTSIKDELNHIGGSYKSDLEIVKGRVRSLEASLGGAVDNSNTASRAQVELRDLERDSDAYRAIYQISLGRLQESAQQQSFPVSEFRVITTADAPLQKSWPKSLLTIALATLSGLIGGTIAALLKSKYDKTIRNGRDFTQAFGGRCTAILPHAETDLKVNKRSELLSSVKTKSPNNLNSFGLRRMLGDTPPQLLEPIRGVKLHVLRSFAVGPCVVIGVLSSRRGEGRSTLAAGLAASFSASLHTTLLIDADLAKPDLTTALEATSSPGLQGILSAHSNLNTAFFTHESSGVDFLSAGQCRNDGRWHDTLSSEAATTAFNDMRKHYKVIVIDFPPLGESLDALALASFVDAFIYVVESSKISSTEIVEMLSAAGEIDQRLAGFILNKAKTENRILYSHTRRRLPRVVQPQTRQLQPS